VSETIVHVIADAHLLAQTVAARLVVRLIDAQAERGLASVALAGGRTANAVYEAVRSSPARNAVDWSHVDLWWSDERFLPTGHAERNETAARATLLDHLPLDPRRVHPMASSDVAPDPEAAAARYTEELAAAAKPGTARLPHFDLVLLGVGEDGHVASIFPEHPAAYETRLVAGVRGSPKPPPNRVTFTLPTINAAAEVWLLAAGTEKASAVGMALTSGPGPMQLPAAGVHGVERTLWLLDRAAASEVPPSLRSLR
jgi:6-phosphogluconolactonase